jgi:hypothetical protein
VSDVKLRSKHNVSLTIEDVLYPRASEWLTTAMFDISVELIPCYQERDPRIRLPIISGIVLSWTLRSMNHPSARLRTKLFNPNQPDEQAARRCIGDLAQRSTRLSDFREGSGDPSRPTSTTQCLRTHFSRFETTDSEAL